MALRIMTYFATVIIANFIQVYCHPSDYLSYGPFGFRPNYARALRGVLLTELDIPTTTKKPGPLKPDLHVDQEWSNSHVGFHLGHDIESRSYDGEDNIVSEIAPSLFKEPASNDDLLWDLLNKNGQWITIPFLFQESIAVVQPETTTKSPTSRRRTPPTTTPFILLPVTETGDYYNPLFRPIYAKAPPPPKSYFLKKLQKTLMKKPSVDLLYYTAATSPETTKTTETPKVEESTVLTTLATTATTTTPSKTTELSMIPVSIKLTALPVTNKPDSANTNILDANYGDQRNDLTTGTTQSANHNAAASTSNRPETTSTISSMVSFDTKPDTDNPVDIYITANVPVDTTGTSTEAVDSYTQITTPYTWKPIYSERLGKIILPDVVVTQSTTTTTTVAPIPPAPEKLNQKRFNSLLDLSMRRGTKRT